MQSLRLRTVPYDGAAALYALLSAALCVLAVLLAHLLVKA